MAVIFVGLRLHDYWADLDFSRFVASDWLVISVLIIIYAFANLLLVFAWQLLLLQQNLKVHPHWSLSTYGISQLAKYLPGNIFHLAGRQAIGMAAGLPGRALGKSMFWN